MDSLPDIIRPQLATLVDRPPVGSNWSYEIKFDGYRMLCRIDNGAVGLFTRNGHDWTGKMPALAQALGWLPVSQAWIDGEVVALSKADFRGSVDRRRRVEAAHARRSPLSGVAQFCRSTRS